MRMIDDYKSIRDAARAYGVKYQTFRTRLSRGWTVKQAGGVTPPPARKRVPKLFEAFGRRRTLAAWAQDSGLSESRLRNRMQRGMTLEAAIKKGQSRSHENARKVMFDGEMVPLWELSQRCGIRYGLLSYRIDKMNMTPEEAAAKKPRAYYKRVERGCGHVDCFSCPFPECRI